VIATAELACEDESPISDAMIAASGTGATPILQHALQIQIMAEVEAVLEKKSDTLWLRGQEELRKMKREQKQVLGSLSELQAQQEVLIKEHSQMRSALLDVTSKLEFVAVEMRQALNTLACRVPNNEGQSLIASQTMSASPPCGQPGVGSGVAAPDDAAVTAVLTAPGLCTPPRAIVPNDAHAPGIIGSSRSTGLAGLTGLTSTRCISASSPWLGSPATPLLLANALSSAPQPTPPSKRLNLAECLDCDDTARAQVAEQHAGQLRAEAPAFFPGGLPLTSLPAAGQDGSATSKRRDEGGSEIDDDDNVQAARLLRFD